MQGATKRKGLIVLIYNNILGFSERNLHRVLNL